MFEDYADDASVGAAAAACAACASAGRAPSPIRAPAAVRVIRGGPVPARAAAPLLNARRSGRAAGRPGMTWRISSPHSTGQVRPARAAVSVAKVRAKVRISMKSRKDRDTSRYNEI